MERAGQYQSISGIVFRSGNCEPVAKAVYLFGIDRKHGKASFDKGLHKCAPGDLNADCNQSWLTRCTLFEPLDQGDETFAAMICFVLLEHAPVSIQHSDAVNLRSPVDSDEVFQ